MASPEFRDAAEPAAQAGVPSLGREAGIALRWNAVSTAITLCSQLAQIVFLARWLSPAEFGLAASALAVLAFLGGLSDLGLTNALVQRPLLTAQTWASAWWAAAAAGVALAVLLAASAVPLEALLHLPGLAPLLVMAALALPWGGPAAVFQAHLQRHLRLRRLAAVEIAAALSGLAVTLAWAWWQRDLRALVAGQITLALVRFAGLGLASSLRPAPRLRASDLRPLSGFGGYQLAERIAAHALSNLDRLLVARLLGPAAAGYYFMAAQIALRPVALLGPFVARTLLPLLARIGADRARTASSYLRSLSLLSPLAAAVYALLFGLAEPLLALVLGPGWEPAVPVLRILSVAGFLMVMGNVLGNLVMALGRAEIAFRITLLVLIGNIAGIAVGARHGLAGVAAALLAVTALSLPIDFLLPRLWLGIRAGALARAGGWALLPAGVAAGGMIALTARLPLAPPTEVPVAAAAGAALFVLTAWVFQREQLRAAWEELADKLGGRKTI
jgi:O-antigen/teichoic acid export membrane protein